MAQYIPKSTLVAEIERLKTIYNDDENIHHVAKYNILVDILSFLNTLEVKEVDYKPMDNDFERDAVNFCFDNGLNTTPRIAKTIAKHFFELGLKTQKGENE